ncbi:DeoR/GlpR family DNA-binding transcription regulator [Desulfosporosinus sp. BICA1-9]|uniref:DeoR/GlpR family DNA-binding transcription regulator n=1 Tax=Desulfosporosinus sp. BICA1-9 TaxID=1531958 RepID=UPI00054BD582|nr:DeoR/GlpR family DNA-binding transcription regulator [Desulfosporosinus sp. BICA1-9]KJS50567.1 MAG: hypothetical protein VR66_02100 [Peptococcaceae bacterium BRH_c23]KJS82834.1 MAG: hypothetical protein JL57_23745 [Desulfosporosinus sp. BICA1-9]
MFGAARLKKIKDIIYEKKQVNVSTLSSMLSVTEVTIRSDIKKLELEGFIIKTHGGATLNEKLYLEIQEERLPRGTEYDRNKEIIGEIAAHIVKEHEAIFLGEGSTCYFIAKALKNKRNITVVTNNLNIANVLAENSSINLILTGGNLVGDTMSLTGEIIQRALKGIFVDKAFISVNGVHITNGFTVSNIEQLNVFRTISNIAKELIVAADCTKFGKTTFAQLGSLLIAKKIITNEDIPNEYKAYFFEEGIQIFTSYEINASIGVE